MDECDLAFDLEDFARFAKVRLASEAAKVRPTTSIRCLECDEATANGARWCGAECRDEYQRRNR